MKKKGRTTHQITLFLFRYTKIKHFFAINYFNLISFIGSTVIHQRPYDGSMNNGHMGRLIMKNCENIRVVFF